MGANIVIQGPDGERMRVNPARDVATFWGQLLARAVEPLADRRSWPDAMRQALDDAAVTPEEMAECGTAIAEACRMAYQQGAELPVEALQLSGFLRCRPVVQAAVCVRIGQVSLGAWWYGIRDSVIEGGVPACNQDLVKAGLVLAGSLNKPHPPETPAV